MAVQKIINGKGSHFDPDLVDAFIDISDQFHEFASLMLQRENLGGKMEENAANIESVYVNKESPGRDSQRENKDVY
jgi:putative two-component system response regulator